MVNKKDTILYLALALDENFDDDLLNETIEVSVKLWFGLFILSQYLRLFTNKSGLIIQSFRLTTLPIFPFNTPKYFL